LRPSIDFARGIVISLMVWNRVSGLWNSWNRGEEGLMAKGPISTYFTQFILVNATY